MEKDKLDTFMTEWMKTHEEGVLPGAMLMKYGPEDYVGATLAVRGTLYFKDSYKGPKCINATLWVEANE